MFRWFGFSNQVYLQERLREGTGQSSFFEDSPICISCFVNGGLGTLCAGLFWMGLSTHVRCCVRESVQVMKWCFLPKRFNLSSRCGSNMLQHLGVSNESNFEYSSLSCHSGQYLLARLILGSNLYHFFCTRRQTANQ